MKLEIRIICTLYIENILQYADGLFYSEYLQGSIRKILNVFYIFCQNMIVEKSLFLFQQNNYIKKHLFSKHRKHIFSPGSYFS